MKEILKLTLSLTLICVIAGVALSYVNTQTAPRIEAAKAIQRAEKMRTILPRDPMDTPVAGEFDGITFYKALDRADGPAYAYCAEGVDGNGFGGNVTVLMTLDPTGKILGVLVSEHSETPGIGTRVCNRDVRKSLWEVLGIGGNADKEPDKQAPTPYPDSCRKESKQPPKVKLPTNPYLDSYAGRMAEGTFAFDGNNAIKPVSGATISSRAVLNAVNRITAAWNANKATITGEAK